MADTASTDELSFARTALTLVRARRTLLVLAFLGGLLGLVSGLLKDREYVSRAVFLPKGAEESASGLALAASTFGVSLPNRSGDWWPAVYVELLNSRALLEAIATDTLVVAELDGRRTTMLDLLEIRGGDLPVRKARAVRALRQVIAATEDKKLGAVKVNASTPWPSVSLALAQRLVKGVHDFNITTRQALAAAERTFVDEQANEAERSLRRAEDELESFQVRNRVIESPVLLLQRERLQREVSLRMQMYSSLLQSREQARLREVRNTPVITMLEEPLMPAIPESRGALLRGILGVLAGTLLGMLYVLGIRQAASASRAEGSGWPELMAELREATPRLLRRWIGL